MNEKTLYTIPAPYSAGDKTIEVCSDPENAWYEWRVRDAGGVGLDTGAEGTYGRQYGSPEIALRDALMVTSDLPDPHELAMQRIEDEEGPQP